MSNSKKQEKKKEVKMSYLFALAGEKKTGLYVSVGFSILSGLCTFVPFIMLYRSIVVAFDQIDSGRIVTYGIIAAISLVLRFLFQAISTGLSHYGAYNALYAVRKKLCDHIGHINLGFFNDHSTGEIKKVLMEDVERLETFLAHQIPDITVAIVVPSVVLIYLFTISVPMALLLLLPILITLIIQSVMIVIAKPAMKEFPSIQGRLNGALIQFVNGMPVMKAYNLTADSYRDYAEADKDYTALWKRVSAYAAPMSAVCKVIIESGIFFTLPVGGILYLNGHLSVGNYLFFIIMSIVFLSSYNNLMNFAQIFSQISAGLGRIKEIMDIPVIPDGSQDRVNNYDLTFSHVNFSYHTVEVLHDLCLTLPQGSLTAFVGASGAGKSTAAQLIPRFWDVLEGSIKLGGIDLKNLKNEALMNFVSFVFQDAFMMEDTIYNNIAIGKTNCSPKEVENAAKAAQIHDLILSLPDGYQTKIGAAGVKLSGGERQRMCIARAILKDAPVIVFDEATSFTDIENEHKIQLALNHLLKGKTTIMIAHRLHTITNADKICVFKEGKIIESGCHEALLNQKGEYAALWRAYTRQEAC